MITEQDYIDYFTGIAQKHLQIKHGVDGRTSFFFIPVAADLTEIDNFIRSTKATPMLLLDAMRGTFSENNSASYLQVIEGQFTILDITETGKAETIREAQNNCLQIGLDILGRMKTEIRVDRVGLNGKANFAIQNVGYDPVGPMEMKHYGYTFRFTITCPFGFSVSSAIWSDK